MRKRPKRLAKQQKKKKHTYIAIHNVHLLFAHKNTQNCSKIKQNKHRIMDKCYTLSAPQNQHELLCMTFNDCVHFKWSIEFRFVGQSKI